MHVILLRWGISCGKIGVEDLDIDCDLQRLPDQQASLENTLLYCEDGPPILARLCRLLMYMILIRPRMVLTW